jgi:hypothetical protein
MTLEEEGAAAERYISCNGGSGEEIFEKMSDRAARKSGLCAFM